jgi:hypothetical protein
MPWTRPRRAQPVVERDQPDLVAQLKDLAELHDAGKVTDDEFAAAKAKLLDG